jgi:hypothetical protein
LVWLQMERRRPRVRSVFVPVKAQKRSVTVGPIHKAEA